MLVESISAEVTERERATRQVFGNKQRKIAIERSTADGCSEICLGFPTFKNGTSMVLTRCDYLCDYLCDYGIETDRRHCIQVDREDRKSVV